MFDFVCIATDIRLSAPFFSFFFIVNRKCCANYTHFRGWHKMQPTCERVWIDNGHKQKNTKTKKKIDWFVVFFNPIEEQYCIAVVNEHKMLWVPTPFPPTPTKKRFPFLLYLAVKSGFRPPTTGRDISIQVRPVEFFVSVKWPQSQKIKCPKRREVKEKVVSTWRIKTPIVFSFPIFLSKRFLEIVGDL